jgi:hypothetical protein
MEQSEKQKNKTTADKGDLTRDITKQDRRNVGMI